MNKDALKLALEALEETIDIPCYGGHPLQETAAAVIKAALAHPAQAEPSQAQQLVNEQAEDEVLWCDARTIFESMLQEALRRLHAAVEAKQAEPNEADQLLTALRLDPDTYRTDGGWLNIPKIVAAIASPADYPYTEEQRNDEPTK